MELPGGLASRDAICSTVGFTSGNYRAISDHISPETTTHMFLYLREKHVCFISLKQHGLTAGPTLLMFEVQVGPLGGMKRAIHLSSHPAVLIQ